MKTYKVVWTETFTRNIEAKNMVDAEEKALSEILQADFSDVLDCEVKQIGK